MKKYNGINVDKPTEPTIEYNSKLPSVNFKSRNSAPKHSPVVSAIMVIPNHHTVDNSDIKLHP